MTVTQITSPISGVVDLIANAVRDIRFGSVEIIIHDSKVVQIERREKLRVEPLANQTRKD